MILSMVSNTNKYVKLAFLGDVYLGQSPAKLDPEVLGLLGQCDNVIANLETPICFSSPISSQKVLLRSEPGTEKVLREWVVTAVTLANNHIFDHGDSGFQSTCEALNSVQIPFCGAGMNRLQAAKPLILDCGTLRIGIIACTEPGTEAKIATDNTSGCHCLAFPELASQIATLKNEVDFVIVTPHWGYCDYEYPPQEVVDNGERLFAAGADLVIGHHSHSVQGFNRRANGQAIAYSLGDFYFGDYESHGRKVTSQGGGANGLILFVDFLTNSLPRVSYEFTHVKDNLVAIDTNRAQREKEFQNRCAPLESLEKYPQFWRKVVRNRFQRRLLYWTNPLRWRHVRLATVHAAFLMSVEMYLKRFRRKN